MDDIILKKCNKCGIEKEFTNEFFPTRNSRGVKYLRVECRVCWSKRNSLYKKKNKTKYTPVAKVKKLCALCGKEFEGRKNKIYCSYECIYNKFKKEKYEQYKIDVANNKRESVKKCKVCEREFETKYKCGSYVYCSEECKLKELRRVRKEHKQKRKYKKKVLKHNGDFDNSITLDIVIEKYNNTCYLCGGQCNSNDYDITNEGHWIVGGSYPSIEHIKPISKGGSHTWDNINLAHRDCNSFKGDSIIDGQAKQLNLKI